MAKASITTQSGNVENPTLTALRTRQQRPYVSNNSGVLYIQLGAGW